MTKKRKNKMHPATQKISISLPENLYGFVENYQKTCGCGSRSEVVTEALKLLQQKQLENCYMEANEEMNAEDDFTITLSDGLDDETW